METTVELKDTTDTPIPTTGTTTEQQGDVNNTPVPTIGISAGDDTNEPKSEISCHQSSEKSNKIKLDTPKELESENPPKIKSEIPDQLQYAISHSTPADGVDSTRDLDSRTRPLMNPADLDPIAWKHLNSRIPSSESLGSLNSTGSNPTNQDSMFTAVSMTDMGPSTSQECCAESLPAASTSAGFDLQSFLLNYRQDTPRQKTTKKFTTITDKMMIIKDSEDGMSQREIAKKFRISKTQVGGILQRKNEYLEQYMGNSNPNRMTKLIRCNDNEAINDMLWKWYRVQMDDSRYVSGSELKSKALELAEMNGINGFKASNGWLQCFRQRHNLIKSKRTAPEYGDNSSINNADLSYAAEQQSDISCEEPKAKKNKTTTNDVEQMEIKQEAVLDKDASDYKEEIEKHTDDFVESSLKYRESWSACNPEKAICSESVSPNTSKMYTVVQHDSEGKEITETVMVDGPSLDDNNDSFEQIEPNAEENATESETACRLKTRKCTTIDEKVRMIGASEMGKSQREIARTFNVAKSTINQILKNRGHYIKLYHDNCNPERCMKYRKTDNEIINQEVWKWYEKVMSLKTGVHITGTLIKEKALDIAKENNLVDFKASNGWLQSFRQRHNILNRHNVGQDSLSNVAKSLDEIEGLLSYFEVAQSANDTIEDDAEIEGRNHGHNNSVVAESFTNRSLLRDVKLEMERDEFKSSDVQPHQDVVTSSLNCENTNHADALKYASRIRNYALEANDMSLLRLISLVHRHLEESPSE